MASAGLNQRHVQLAQSLPPRLLNFFKKHPPPAITAPALSATQASQATASTSEPPVSENAPATADPTLPQAPETDLLGRTSHEARNPFVAWKHPRTQRWYPPAYSLRRQADLIKLAQKHNVLSLMPWSSKIPEEKEQKRREHGLRVQGTGEGKKVKGKMWERTLKGRLDQRQKAMEGMGEMIRQWKERGHGRGWKKWPK